MRLAQAGDFNIELDYTDLLPGNNQVVITALDNALASSQAVVTVSYSAAATWTPQTLPVMRLRAGFMAGAFAKNVSKSVSALSFALSCRWS